MVQELEKMKVAVKHINKALFSSQDLFVIRQECEILRTCNHPNVVRIYDCIEDD
jgi:serine/threonine protein kinase